MSLSRSRWYHELIETATPDGCPVCGVLRTALERHLAALSDYRAHDAGTQQRLVRSRGLCAQHGERLLRHGSSPLFGAASLLEPLLARLQAGDPTTPPDADCPVCAFRQDLETRLLHSLVAAWPDADLQTALTRSGGLCLPHLRRLPAPPGHPLRRFLAQQATDRLYRLHDDLSAFIRRHDYRHQGQPFGPERDAVQHTLRFLHGDPAAQ